MNKNDFLRALEAGLAGASPEERVAAMQYYTEYFDEAGPEREEEVLAELGEPKKLADEIIAASGGTPAPEAAPQDGQPAAPPPQQQPPPPPVRGGYTPVNYNPYTPPPKAQSNTPAAVKVLLIVLLAIVLVPIFSGLFGVLVGLLATIIVLFFIPFILAIAFLASGAVTIVAGGIIATASVGSGVLSIGIGIVLIGLALLCLYGGILLVGRVLPRVMRAIFDGVSSLWRRFSTWFKSI